MDKVTLKKAIELDNDIKSMSMIIKEKEVKHHWIKIIALHQQDHWFSNKFETELTEWLKQKVIEYKKELEEL